MTKAKKQILPALHQSGKVKNPDMPDVEQQNYTSTVLKYANLALPFPQLETKAKRIVPAINELWDNRVIANPPIPGASYQVESEDGYIIISEDEYIIDADDEGGGGVDPLNTIKIDGVIYKIVGGSGVSYLKDLQDVKLQSLSDGQILRYDSSTARWINVDGGGEYTAGAGIYFTGENDSIINADAGRKSRSRNLLTFRSNVHYPEDIVDWKDTGTTISDKPVYQSLGGTYQQTAGNSIGTYSISGARKFTIHLKQDVVDSRYSYIVLGRPNTPIDLATSDYEISYKGEDISDYTSYEYNFSDNLDNTIQVMFHKERPPFPIGVTLDLNNGQWRDTGTTVGGNEVYESDAGSWHINNGESVCTIYINGVTSISLYVSQSSEYYYDYCYIGNLDEPVSKSNYRNTTYGVGAGYVTFTFNCSPEQHFIQLMYAKDGGDYEGEDRGYFYYVVNSMGDSQEVDDTPVADGDSSTDRAWIYGESSNPYLGEHGEVFNDYDNNYATGDYAHAEGNGTIASGPYSHTEGVSTKALKYGAHAEGDNTIASGLESHAEGASSIASGEASHAEGHHTQATDSFAHAEGHNTIASGQESHAEGYNSVASGATSHAEGRDSQAIGLNSHAEGYITIASGENSHTEGYMAKTTANDSHAEGQHSIASGVASHAEGYETQAKGAYSHAEGGATIAAEDDSHAEGRSTEANGRFSHSEGVGTIANGRGSHAEGIMLDLGGSTLLKNIANDDATHVEGFLGEAYGFGSHVESFPVLKHSEYDSSTTYNSGDIVYIRPDPDEYSMDSILWYRAIYDNIEGIYPTNNNYWEEYRSTDPGDYFQNLDGKYGSSTTASGLGAHAEGAATQASNYAAHSEGMLTSASGYVSHTEGMQTTASNSFSHAEGSYTKARGEASHAEGHYTVALGGNSHAEGYYSQATYLGSHAEGYNTIASGDSSHSEGRCTAADGIGSHAEGYGYDIYCNVASGTGSHAEGYYTLASGSGAHAEGYGDYSNTTPTTASGVGSHAEGYRTKASASFSHSEGYNSRAEGQNSHAEGGGTCAMGMESHTEGSGTYAYGYSSHAEGAGTFVYSNQSHVEGSGNHVYDQAAHVEGAGNCVSSFASHVEGTGNVAIPKATMSHTEGSGNFNYGHQTHAEGAGNTVSGEESHVEGAGNNIHGPKTHGEGGGNTAYGLGSHVEGKHNVAVGFGHHAEGFYNIVGASSTPNYFSANSTYSVGDIVAINALYNSYNEENTNFLYRCTVAPGQIQAGSGVEIITPTSWNSSSTYAAGSVVYRQLNYYRCYLIFYATKAASGNDDPLLNANNSWSLIKNILSPMLGTTSSGYYLLDVATQSPSKVAKIAQGTTISPMWEPVATNLSAHVEGYKNIALGDYQHVQGKFNVADSTKAFIIGNGTATDARSNALTVDWSGNMTIAGDLTTGVTLNTTAQTLGAAINEISVRVPAPPTTDGTYTLSLTITSGVPTYSWVSS